ncbi:hypothetical protein HNR65_000305 [Desulfosalsimonas propionicica]|uniref:Polysaccharide pyruvyl transferase domain-containing protein n=1 Tax=Desulfosalsimonas propionicica TaxID=332175 RepID=A0A7W0C6H1_9BACT|nr:polysaccharide pyruvyl transferase family protein [Desulfosalsimonas propionicica]MBA2879998.1 hypothetical protein [Desulfosalsimonas propionicica]
MIGILTFHHVYNYGALLQAYGLQTYIASLGYDVTILNVRPFHRSIRPRSRFSRVFDTVKDKVWPIESKKEAANSFDAFRNKWLQLSQPYDSLKKALRNETAIESLVVGSDQVWNPKYGKKALDTYFLRDAPAEIRKIGYAACAGSKTAPIAKLHRYKRFVEQFHAIGVRDEFTKEIIQSITNLPVNMVVDPSLLIDWDFVSEHARPIQVPGEYIFYYGRTNAGERALEQLEKAYHLPVVSPGMEGDHNTDSKYESMESVGPLEWVNLLKNSSMVVTRSFHGLMFALKLNKPVIVAPANQISLDRLEDACRRFEIKDCLLDIGSDGKDGPKKINRINFQKARAIMDNELIKSRRYLDESLMKDE